MNLILKPLIVFNLLISSSFVYSQNFWQGVPGPTGTVNHYAINSSGYIFISGGCGLLRSTDDGESWTGVQPSNFGEISITINSSDHVFVGTNGDGIYKSTNNGGSWTQINNGLTNLYVYSLATHQNDDIYAGLYLDVCKSTDNGNTWSPTNLNAMFIHAIDINTNGVIFAAANTVGVYKSTDNGATWNICNNGLTTANIFTLRISPNDDIYLGTVNGGAFRSTDEGNSWMQIGLTGYEVRCFA
ncbi:MAG: exo-alpha-sialidase, partial [Ignavibacteriaceae bacterium]|nr:exo-alpha-sialidase [Ignavibacteriaceae bacterium]